VVLDAYRHLADVVLDPIARRLSGVSPNALSAAALVSAGFAGISFLFPGGWPLALGAFFVFLNALLDALDGKVAKITGKASRRGDFLDHVLDRYADVLMLGGLAIGPYVPVWLGLLARDYRGILGRADRLVILVIAAVLQAGFDPNSIRDLGIEPLRYSVLGWAMVLFAVLGNLTAIQRAVSTWRQLS